MNMPPVARPRWLTALVVCFALVLTLAICAIASRPLSLGSAPTPSQSAPAGGTSRPSPPKASELLPSSSPNRLLYDPEPSVPEALSVHL
jgi:hypothetical protein